MLFHCDSYKTILAINIPKKKKKQKQKSNRKKMTLNF